MIDRDYDHCDRFFNKDHDDRADRIESKNNRKLYWPYAIPCATLGTIAAVWAIIFLCFKLNNHYSFRIKINGISQIKEMSKQTLDILLYTTAALATIFLAAAVILLYKEYIHRKAAETEDKAAEEEKVSHLLNELKPIPQDFSGEGKATELFSSK